MIEDVLKEVRTALRTNLAAALDAEDAEYAAADVAEFGAVITLNDVATDSYRFEEFDEVQIQNLPAILLLPRGAETAPWVSTEIATLIHDVDLLLIERDTDPERLSRRIFRFAEAVRRVMSQRVEGTGTAEDPAFQVDEAGADWSPTWEIGPGGLTKAARLRYRLHEVEARP